MVVPRGASETTAVATTTFGGVRTVAGSAAAGHAQHPVDSQKNAKVTASEDAVTAAGRVHSRNHFAPFFAEDKGTKTAEHV